MISKIKILRIIGFFIIVLLAIIIQDIFGVPREIKVVITASISFIYVYITKSYEDKHNLN